MLDGVQSTLRGVESHLSGQSGGASPPELSALVLTWTSEVTVNEPTFEIDFPPTSQVGDDVNLDRSQDDFATWDRVTLTIASIVGDVVTLSGGGVFDFGAPWPDGDYKVRASSDNAADSNVVDVEIATGAGAGAPALTSPQATTTALTTATASVTTDQNNGTIFAVCSPSATPPTAAQIEAGQDHTGTLLAAGQRKSVSVISTGNQVITGGFTGISGGYYVHFVHKNAGGTYSNVVSSTRFETFNVAAVVTANRGFDNTDLAIYSITGIDLGAEANNRKFLVFCNTAKVNPGHTTISVKINGVAGTKITGASQLFNNGSATSSFECHEITLPLGTTGTLEVELSATVTRCPFMVARVCGGAITDSDKAVTGSGSTCSLTALTIPTDGVGIVFGFNSAGTAWNAATGFTEDFDVKSAEADRIITGGRVTTPGTNTITVTANASGEIHLGGVAYGPV